MFSAKCLNLLGNHEAELKMRGALVLGETEQ